MGVPLNFKHLKHHVNICWMYIHTVRRSFVVIVCVWSCPAHHCHCHCCCFFLRISEQRMAPDRELRLWTFTGFRSSISVRNNKRVRKREREVERWSIRRRTGAGWDILGEWDLTEDVRDDRKYCSGKIEGDAFSFFAGLCRPAAL